MTLMTMIAQSTGIPEGLLNWILSTYGLVMLTQVWAFIQMPRQIKLMRDALVDHNDLLRLRVWPKIARLENYEIEKWHRENPDKELPEILIDMRKDQYPEADARDKELQAKKRKQFEASLT